jgi:hypothetical protein
MDYIYYVSYTRPNLDAYLERFDSELFGEVRLLTGYLRRHSKRMQEA